MSYKTDIAKKCITFTWYIENFSFCWQKQCENLFSPVFEVDAMEGTKWKLLLRPIGDERKNYVSFFLNREKDSNGPDSMDIRYKLAFLSADDSVLVESQIVHNLFEKDLAIGVTELAKREEVFTENRDKYLPGDTLTARCTIWSSDVNITETKQFFARTVIKVERRSFGWNIREFSTIEPEQKNSLKIKSTSNEDLIDFDFVSTGGQYFQEKYVINVTSLDEDIKILMLDIYVLDVEGKKENCGQQELFFNNDQSSGALTLFRTKKDIVESKSKYLKNDILSLFCECAFSTGIAFEGIERIVSGITPTKTSNEFVEIRHRPKVTEGKSDAAVGLNDDLRSLYNSGEFCDIKIRVKQEKIPAHKTILIARSPVFKAMFSKDMREKNEECVEISDIDSGILRQMFLYMYTDTLEDLDWENALQLYEAADKYEILPLKNKCASFLKDNFCETKASGVLLLADMHHDTDLKNAAEDYILKHAQSIFLSEDWTDFCDTNPKLATETMRLNWKKGKV